MTEDLDAPTLSTLIELVYVHTGIAMPPRKSILLQGRLRPRLRQLGLVNYSDYLQLVASDKAEVQLFINMVTTNDTGFFRTPHVWKFFSEKLLPNWSTTLRNQPLKIWSAAASSGEEAYSIAMLCTEFKQQHPDFHYQILATDISTETISIAKAGNYVGRSLDGLKRLQPDMLRKYFIESADGAQVNSELQKNIRFGEHNLLRPLPSAEKFDIVFLRNVLIYFDDQSQESVIGHARQSMRDGGHLVLGESESLGRVKTDLQHEAALVYSAPAGVL